MYLFYLSIILIAVGSFICIKGDSSKLSPPSGGGSRISPEAQVRLNSSVQTITGHKEDYTAYYKNNNVFRPSKIGLILLISGIILMVLYLYI
jgi:hypothetical protein